MCEENCECNCEKEDLNLQFTDIDLKLEFRNNFGLSPENEPAKYIKWLEEKAINQRKIESNVEKANGSFQKVIIDELNDEDETSYLLSSKTNAKHIQDSIDEFGKGEAKTQELIDER